MARKLWVIQIQILKGQIWMREKIWIKPAALGNSQPGIDLGRVGDFGCPEGPE